MKVYLSSTSRDLRDHRAAIDRTLRRMGHDVIGMEQYVAEGTRPLSRCRADVQACDVYLLVLAWRYGSVVKEEQDLSVTELEYREAILCKKPILAFLLDPEVAWPLSHVDALSADPAAALNIARLRSEVGANYLAGIFTSPEDLASQAAAAVSRQRFGLSMAERLLSQDSVNATSMKNFGSGGPVESDIGSIIEMVKNSGSARALLIDLEQGDEWWSTRLFLLASLLKELTSVRQIVFRSRGQFAGMASPSALIDGMGEALPELGRIREALREQPPSFDTEQEINRQLGIWRTQLADKEFFCKVGVRRELLERWLCERMVTRCITIDVSGPTMSQVQQIIDSLLLDLPVVGHFDPDSKDSVQLRVICRDSFALAVAREWVRSSMPRMHGPYA